MSLALKLSVFICVYLWLLPPLSADWKTGAAYYEAGDYPKAIAAFEEVLSCRLTQKQESVARYDLATARLAHGDALGALRDYGTIDLSDEPEPRLVRSVWIGKARAHSLYADQLLEREQFGLCRAALFEALGALQEIEEVDEELVELRLVIKAQTAQLLTAWKEHYWNNLSEADAAAGLAAMVGKTMNQLESLGLGAGEGSLVRQLGGAQRSLRPFWEVLEEKRSDDTLTRAASLHRCGSERMEEGQIWGARRDLAETSYLLNQVETEAREGDTLAAALKGRETVCARLGVTGSGPLRKAVAAERDIWSRAGRALCAERRSSSEDAVEQQMLRTLEERLRTPDPDRQRALADSWLYTLIDTPSVDGVIDLHAEVARGTGSESWQPRLAALEAKTRAEGFELAADRLAVAEQLAAGERIETGEIASNLEEALRALELRAWLRLKFNDWKGRANDKSELVNLCQEGADCMTALQEAGEQRLMEVVWNAVEGWRVATEEKRGCAGLCVEEAHHWIERGERIIGKPPESAAELLTIGIDEQEHAKAKLAHLDDLSLLQSIRSEVTEMMLRKEQALLEEMEGFVGLLFAESGDLQKEPFKSALRLFDEGVEEGKGVFPLLTQDFENWGSASSSAERSEEKWREALKELGGEGDDEQEGDEGEDEAPDQDEEEESNAPSEALELLQEMDRQDEAQTSPKRLPKQGLRPW